MTTGRINQVLVCVLNQAPSLAGYRKRCLLRVFPLRKGETKGGRSTLNPVRLRNGWPGVGQPLNARRAPPATLCVEARAPPCKPYTKRGAGAAVASDERYRGRLRRRGAAERATARCARPRASTRGEPRGARTAARHRQVASKLNYPKPCMSPSSFTLA